MTANGGSLAHRASGAGGRSERLLEALVVLVASSTLIGCFDLFHSDEVVVEAPTARQVTARNMAVLDRRIGNYVRRHGSVPTTLAAVVFSAPPEDGFGHPLQLIPLGTTSWELWSPGSDGRVGGQGDAADVTWSMLRGELHEADSL